MTSQKMKAIIIDSSEESQKKLGALLMDFCEDIQLLGSLATLEGAEELVKVEKVDLAFVSSDLGIKSIAEFWESEFLQNTEIVFLCKRDHEYIDTFERLSMEYLTLPVTISKLIKVEKNVRILSESRQGNAPFDQAIMQINNVDHSAHELILPVLEEQISVSINTILYCIYDGSRTHFNIQGGLHYIVAKNIKTYEDLLADYGFIRTHNSALINLEFVKTTDRSQVTMIDGKKIPLSKIRRKEVQDKLQAE